MTEFKTLCNAVAHTTGADCTNTGKYMVNITVQGSNAYLRTKGEGASALLCGLHTNQLQQGKSILLNNTYLNNKEDNMNITGTPIDQVSEGDIQRMALDEPLDMYHKLQEEESKMKNKGVKCGKCGITHNNVNEVRACYGVVSHQKINSTTFFATRKEAVNEQIRLRGGKVEWVPDKGWHVVRLHNS